jgi:hypothetical protein
MNRRIQVALMLIAFALPLQAQGNPKPTIKVANLAADKANASVPYVQVSVTRPGSGELFEVVGSSQAKVTLSFGIIDSVSSTGTYACSYSSITVSVIDFGQPNLVFENRNGTKTYRGTVQLLIEQTGTCCNSNVVNRRIPVTGSFEFTLPQGRGTLSFTLPAIGTCRPAITYFVSIIKR